MRHTYTGIPVPALIPCAFWEGWTDRDTFRRCEQLYRFPRWKRALYRLGWWLSPRRKAR